MAPETAANDLALIRSATHEDNEILMQQEEKLHPKRYNRVMKQIFGRDDIMKFYRALSHYKEPKRQSNNIIFNDLIAKAFEILFLIDEGLVYPDELKPEEREFLALMRPILQAKDSIGRYKNFSKVFFDVDKRTKAIKALQENKDERFYRVANAAAFDGAAKEYIYPGDPRFIAKERIQGYWVMVPSLLKLGQYDKDVPYPITINLHRNIYMYRSTSDGLERPPYRLYYTLYANDDHGYHYERKITITIEPDHAKEAYFFKPALVAFDEQKEPAPFEKWLIENIMANISFAVTGDTRRLCDVIGHTEYRDSIHYTDQRFTILVIKDVQQGRLGPTLTTVQCYEVSRDGKEQKPLLGKMLQVDFPLYLPADELADRLRCLMEWDMNAAWFQKIVYHLARWYLTMPTVGQIPNKVPYRSSADKDDATSGNTETGKAEIRERSRKALGRYPTPEEFPVIWWAHLTQAPYESGTIGIPDVDGIYRHSTLSDETIQMKYAVLAERGLFSKDKIKRLFDYGACGKEKKSASGGAVGKTSAIPNNPMEYLLNKTHDARQVCADNHAVGGDIEPARTMSFDETVDYLDRYPADNFMYGYFIRNFVRDMNDKDVEKIIKKYKQHPITLWLAVIIAAGLNGSQKSALYVKKANEEHEDIIGLASDDIYIHEILDLLNPARPELQKVIDILSKNQRNLEILSEEDIKTVLAYTKIVLPKSWLRKVVAVSEIKPAIMEENNAVDTGMGLREMSLDESHERALHVQTDAIRMGEIVDVTSNVVPPYSTAASWRVTLESSAGGISYKLTAEEQTYGKGMTRIGAGMSSIYEMFERISSFAGCGKDWPECYKAGLKLRKARYSELLKSGENALNPNTMNFDTPYFDENIYWVNGEAKTEKGVIPILIPAQSVFCLSNFGEAQIRTYSTNGLASGNTMAEAKREALLEIIERDGKSTMFYTPEKCFMLTAQDADVKQMLDVHKNKGINIQFLDMTTEFGVPIYKAFIKVKDQVIMGSGADLDARIAVRRALGELLSNIKAYEHDFGAITKDALFEPAGKTFVFEALENYSTGKVNADVDMIERLLLANGYTPLYVDLTRKDLNIPVVRVIVPGLDIPKNFTARQWTNFERTFIDTESERGHTSSISTPRTSATGAVQQAFSALNLEAKKVSQLNSSVSRLRGTSQNLMEVNKFKFCLPIEVLRNSPDIALALNTTGLLKQKPQDAENIEFELVVTGVTEEDVKLIEGLNRDDIKKALNLPKKFTVSVITEAQIQETAQRFGYDASNPKNRVAIVKDFFSGALANGEYMAIATDAIDSTEKADLLKEELERELKAELSQENISIRVLVRPESGKSMYSLSKIINDWLEAINQGNFSTISMILPIPAPLTPELEKAIRTAWTALTAA